MDAALIAVNPRYTGDDERLVLKEVQVPPCLLNRVVHLAPPALTRWTAEGRALLEVHVNPELTQGDLKVGAGNQPRRDESKGGGEQRVGVHIENLGQGLDPQRPTDHGTEPK